MCNAYSFLELIDKWWESKDVDENGNLIDCEANDKARSDTAELDMDNVGGVFLVLAVGILLSILVGILEFVWSIRRTSIDERVSILHSYLSYLEFLAMQLIFLLQSDNPIRGL